MIRFLSLATLMSIGCTGEEPDDGKQRFTILHTNDWQSHMLGWGPNAEYTPDTTGDDSTVGGLARTKTLVESIRATSEHPVVLYDGGDWMAGALFQLLATSHAAELQMMQEIGYDAITIGNHEFDWGPAVLGDMIAHADSLGVEVPILAANIHPNTEDAGDDSLEAHFDSGRIQPTMVQELDNGLRLGLFGLLGDEAQSITPAIVPSGFSPQNEAGAAAVAELSAQDVDLIIAITHAGVTDNPTTSPDHVLAAAVPEIDIIVGGHSHTPLFEPQRQGNTLIVQAGAYTRYLGQLDLAWNGKKLEVEGYTLHELDDSLLGDDVVTSKVDDFIGALEVGPLAALGYTFDEPILDISGDMAVDSCQESGLGNLITDAYRIQANAADLADPIDFAFESQGLIRADLIAGTSGVEAFSDTFRVLPLGIGTDDVPGYGLVSFYVTAQEVKDVCEVTASISPSYGCDYFIEVSGMRCRLDTSKSSFNRARGVDVWDEASSDWVELDTSDDNTELYHVAVDSYVASLLGILEGLTYGAIIATAKDATGTPYASVDDMLIDADPTTDGIQELKLWQAVIAYAQTFEDTDGNGAPNVPDSYLQSAGRIIDISQE